MRLELIYEKIWHWDGNEYEVKAIFTDKKLALEYSLKHKKCDYRWVSVKENTEINWEEIDKLGDE